MDSTSPLRRLALTGLCVLGVALIAWSGYWFHAQARIQDEVAQATQRLQEKGGSFLCAERRWSGFPLRIQLHCASARLDVPGGTQINTDWLEAGGHIFTPHRIAARADRMSIEGARNWSIAGHNIAVAAARERNDRLAFGARVDALTLAEGRMPPLALANLVLEASIDNPPRRLTGDLAGVLRDATRRGSRLIIDRFTAELADIEITASGTIDLGSGAPNGTLSTTVSDYKALLSELERRGAISRKAARASAMVIGLLKGGTSKEGGTTIALRFRDGQVYWGPVAVAEFPPLR